MKFAKLELQLTPQQVLRALRDRLPQGQVEIRNVHLEPNLALIELDARLLGVSVPVRLAVCIADADPKLLRLRLSVENFALLPPAWRATALRRLLDGICYCDSETDTYLVSVAGLQHAAGVRFDLAGVEIQRGLLWVELHNFDTSPGDAAEEAVPDLEPYHQEASSVDGEREAAEKFLDKFNRVAGRIGREAAANLRFLWEAFRDPDVPARAKMIVVAALLYFVLPFDAVPDFLAGLGLSDDLAVAAAAVVKVKEIIEAHRRNLEAAEGTSQP